MSKTRMVTNVTSRYDTFSTETRMVTNVTSFCSKLIACSEILNAATNLSAGSRAVRVQKYKNCP